MFVRPNDAYQARWEASPAWTRWGIIIRVPLLTVTSDPVSQEVRNDYYEHGDAEMFSYHFPGALSLILGDQVTEDCQHGHSPRHADYDRSGKWQKQDRNQE